MAINLHEKCLERLEELLPEALRGILVYSNSFISNRPYNLEKINKVLSKETLELLSSYISEKPFSDFVIGIINRDLDDTYESPEEFGEIKKLIEYEKYSDLKTASKKLTEDFNTLPWNYHFSYTFKNFDIKRIFGNYRLSEQVELFIPDKETETNYPVRSDIPNRENKLFQHHIPSLGGILPSSLEGFYKTTLTKPEIAGYWNEDFSYIRIKLDGFVSTNTRTKTVRQAIFILKSFIGFCLSHKIFIFEPYRNPVPSIEWLIVHKVSGNTNEILETYELPENITYGTNNIYLNPSLEESDKYHDRALDLMKNVSAALYHKDKANDLMLASNWYFDSLINKNDLLAFVQAVVVLEILLGDKAKSDIIGIGELLRNRCAYLISDNIEERDEILNKFNEIYKVRSKIVHGGKNELELEEKKSLKYLQEVCARVIRAEIKLISDNNQE